MKRFHIFSFLLALLISCILWYMVIGRELVDTIVEMRLDYRGIPSDVIVRSGLENKVRLRIRGPQGLITNLNTKNEAHVVDLSKIKPGKSVVPLNITSPHTAFSIMEVSPSSLELDVDMIAEKKVPVVVQFSEVLSSDITILHTKVSEHVITLRGPESILATIKEAPIVIELPDKMQDGYVSFTLSPKIPRDVEAIPPTIVASIEFQITTKTVSIVKEISVRGVDGLWDTVVKPQEVTVKVTVPASMKMSDIKKSIEAYVMLPRFIKQGSTRLPIRIQSSEFIQVTNTQPKVVTITITQSE
ncbi:MAG: hypothetical protein K2M30_01195 [Desulfovibrionaceae bacterium]|nr:hypothetical protein [Desulfovibrionaceae bacterium]